MKSFIALSALLAVAFADHPAPAPYHPAPYHPAPAYKPAPYHPAPSYKEDPAVYQYQYAVSDEYAGLNFGADEARDGYSTQGKYSVALPDGRIQTVSYNVADAYSGYVADVTYSGEAKYEPYHPAPAPYKPAPPTTLPQLHTNLPACLQACSCLPRCSHLPRLSFMLIIFISVFIYF
nr:cuticle protein 7-like [Lepeophtheirus salmonis]